MNKIVAPKETFVSGIVVGVSAEMDKNNKKFRMITVEASDGKQEVFPVNQGFYEKNLDTLAIDASVTLKFQDTIKDTTQYVDRQTGEAKFHTSTGRALSSVTRRSGVASKMAALDTKIDQLVMKFEDRPELIGQVAQAYAHLLR